MKKMVSFVLAMLLVICMVTFTGCNSVSDPGTPPENVIHPEQSETAEDNDSGANEYTGSVESEDAESKNAAYEGELLENAVSVRIGQEGRTEHKITMYNNAASNTMLGYLSGSPLLFPTYSYVEDPGFVGQYVRGSYTRDDETTVEDIHVGELYLFSDGQLRLYFKDVEGANITATPIGYFVETEGLTETVQEAYESNLDDVWGVDVYFLITKLID